MLAVVCVPAAEGNEVSAIIDASDFPRLRRNPTRTKAWNGSDHYHDIRPDLGQDSSATASPAL
jgi:hypothetical protein